MFNGMKNHPTDQPYIRRVMASEGWIYFAHAEAVEMVKIGIARDVYIRFANLKVTSPVPLTLLGSFLGTGQTEADLHYEFRHLWSHGEWFHAGEQLLARIEALCPNKAGSHWLYENSGVSRRRSKIEARLAIRD